MGDRFYQQMREKTGWAPGLPEYLKNKRRRRMAWTDESKQQAIDLYTEQDPTPETSMEIVKDIADELGESPNGVRMILTRAGVYVKKNPSAGSSSGGSTGGGDAVGAIANARSMLERRATAAAELIPS